MTIVNQDGNPALTVNQNGIDTPQLKVQGNATVKTLSANGLAKFNAGIETQALTVTGITKMQNLETADIFSININATKDISATGNMTANSFLSTSDRRLKKNIVELEDSLGKVCKLGGYTFDWASRHEGHSVGVMAQEVAEVLPDAVVVNEDGYMQVDYTRLVPLLIGSIKELKYQLEAQRTPLV